MRVCHCVCLCVFTEPQGAPAVTKSSKKSDGHSIFSWIIVLALLGAWMSVAVVWFDLVEYNSVVGTCLAMFFFLACFEPVGCIVQC